MSGPNAIIDGKLYLCKEGNGIWYYDSSDGQVKQTNVTDGYFASEAPYLYNGIMYFLVKTIMASGILTTMMAK